MILCVKQMSKEFQKRHLRILEQLESKIDPFDFDVFYRHLQNHLARQTTRANVSNSLSRINCTLSCKLNVIVYHSTLL